jgi:hypothetical protein
MMPYQFLKAGCCCFDEQRVKVYRKDGKLLAAHIDVVGKIHATEQTRSAQVAASLVRGRGSRTCESRKRKLSNARWRAECLSNFSTCIVEKIGTEGWVLYTRPMSCPFMLCPITMNYGN